ncbi:MAG TPA: Clp protease N-terminal domain-containing protein [Planctomycetaceae bacterium]|jgi:ATP-dependent Clp protease ATP-binding subunit ClpC|nr:Clp protease N-terminal domain-containing protein [Planctomycetaceae bacterium]
MYEQFSDPARIVMRLAEQEARHWKHEYLGPQHILLGLVKQGSGVAANVLKNLDVDARLVAHQVQIIFELGNEPIPSAKLRLTPRAKTAILFAMEEARGLHHEFVGTPHLLLGLRRDEESVAGQILMYFGIGLETLRQETAKLLGQHE